MADTGTETAAQYGISEALFNDPIYGEEIRAVFNLFKAERIGEALDLLFKSKYYTTLGTTVRTRLKQKLEQPEVYADSVDKYKNTQRRRLVATGVKIDGATLDSILSQAYEKGLDDNQVDNLIKFSGAITGFGGDILGDTSSLKAYANAFGVGKLLDTAYWDQKANELFMGTTTAEDIQAQIRATSASAFPGYVDQINNGVTVDSIASAYKGTMAAILERDADSISYDDPTLRAALQYVGPDGKPAVKPLWQFEKELRSRPEWEYTNNARETIDNLSLKILKDWGLV